jgi:FkbM family methyltransferase
VDGGANIGLASLYFLNQYPSARVEAYEANPETCALLRKTLASAQFAIGRYSIHENALHTRSGSIPFYIIPGVPSALNSSIAGRDDLLHQGDKIDVPAVDIRSLLDDPIDLLKLDVEGHEYELLDAAEINPENVKAMIVEFHDMDQHIAACERIFTRFKNAGYRIEMIDGPGLDATSPAAWQGSHMIRIYAA